MAHGRGKYGIDSRITCVSPLWKHSSGSSVVTLKMRPPPTNPFTSLDTFMAAHSPRRFCQARQRYLLKPLGFEKRISVDTAFKPIDIIDSKHEERPKSRSQAKAKRSLQLSKNNSYSNGPKRENTCSPSTSTSAQDSSSDQEQTYNRILHLGKCKLSNEEDFVNSCEIQEKFKPSTSFRPGTTKLPFTFSRSASIPNSPRETTDLIAIGTISMTSQRHPLPKPQSRWKTKATLNLKGSKYPDPMAGAQPNFQSRMTEMAQLELETIKYEKGRRIKKKSPT